MYETPRNGIFTKLKKKTSIFDSFSHSSITKATSFHPKKIIGFQDNSFCQVAEKGTFMDI